MKSKSDSKKIDQIELFKKSGRGGARLGAGHPKGEGSTVLRIPNGCLKAVTTIIELHKAGKLNGRMISLRSNPSSIEPSDS